MTRIARYRNYTTQTTREIKMPSDFPLQPQAAASRPIHRLASSAYNCCPVFKHLELPTGDICGQCVTLRMYRPVGDYPTGGTLRGLLVPTNRCDVPTERKQMNDPQVATLYFRMILTLIVLACAFMVVLTKQSAAAKHWAFGIIGTILGLWFKSP